MSHKEPYHEQTRRIDTVLQALPGTAPDAAMQDRVLAMLRHAETERGAMSAPSQQPSLWRWPWPAAAPWLAAATLLCAAGGMLLHWPNASPKQQHTYAETSNGGQTALIQQRGTTAVPVQVASMLPGPRPFHSQAVNHVTVALDTPIAVHSSGTVDTSFAPPPLPMTQQERLLLRLARHEPTEQLAQLTDPAREATFQRQKDAVAEFFATAPAADDEEDDTSGTLLTPAAAAAANAQPLVRETP